MATIELVKLTARRSGAGITVVGQDAAGVEHRFTGLDEVALIGGSINTFRSGSTLGFQPAALPAAREPA